MIGYRRKRLVGLAAIVAMVAVSFLAATRAGQERYRAAIAEHQALQALRSRLTVQLAALSQDGSALALPDAVAWPGSGRAAIEAALQEQVLGLAEANGLDLTSFGPAPGPAEVKTGMIAYQIEATASWDEVLHFVRNAGDVRPPLGLSDLALRSASSAAQPGQPQLFVRAVFWGFAPGLGTAP